MPGQPGPVRDGRPAHRRPSPDRQRLVRAAGVRPSTASEHLAQLIGGGLVTMTRQGRHRYFSLASPEIAEALESLARICPRTAVRSLTASREAVRLGFAPPDLTSYITSW